MAKWWLGLVLVAASGCGTVPTMVDTSGVAIDPEGRVWFVKRNRIEDFPDSVYLVKCTRDDPPECTHYRIEGFEDQPKRRKSNTNTSGSSSIPM